MFCEGVEIRLLHGPAAARPVAIDERIAVIAILDYGAGNLRSVENTLGEIGAQYTLVRDAAGLRNASKIVLPGVGHFGQMMRALDQLGVRDALTDRIRTGVPFLGICLGLQALFSSSARNTCTERLRGNRSVRIALSSGSYS